MHKKQDQIRNYPNKLMEQAPIVGECILCNYKCVCVQVCVCCDLYM